MKVSLTASNTHNARGIFGAPGRVDNAYASLDVPGPIEFGVTTKFFFCSDLNGVPHAYCEVVGLALWYEFNVNTDGMNLFAGLYRILLLLCFPP